VSVLCRDGLCDLVAGERERPCAWIVSFLLRACRGPAPHPDGRYWSTRPGARGHVFPANRAFEACLLCPRVPGRGLADVPVSYPRRVVCLRNGRQGAQRERLDSAKSQGQRNCRLSGRNPAGCVRLGDRDEAERNGNRGTSAEAFCARSFWRHFEMLTRFSHPSRPQEPVLTTTTTR